MIMSKTLNNPYEAKKIGMLTPSSNTVLEPLCSSMVSGLEDVVTMHYSRFRVTIISLEDDALHQFDFTPMLHAAELLADADVDVIAWNGTSGGWLGLDVDRKLCELITKETGIPATTSMLSQLKLFNTLNVHTIHLITPYLSSIQDCLKKEYSQAGISIVNDENLGLSLNRSFSQVSQSQIQEMFAHVCTSPADAISVVCTNFPAMWSVPKMEAYYHIPIIDTINCVVWDCMQILGLPTNLITNNGMIFNIQS